MPGFYPTSMFPVGILPLRGWSYSTPNFSASFLAFIVSDEMVVVDLRSGTIKINQILISPDIATGTKVLGQLGGSPGGVGAYRVSIAQTVPTADVSALSTIVGQPRFSASSKQAMLAASKFAPSLRGEIDQ